MKEEPAASHRERLFSDRVFGYIEHLVYIAIAALLAATAALTLASAAVGLWHGMLDWSNTQTAVNIVDPLLFVLMLIEILHTVRVSIRTGTLTAEPFLIVGLIASIRRVLVITLQTSTTMTSHNWSDTVRDEFNATMMELGILAAMILVMVVCIYLLHRSAQLRGDPGSDTTV